MQITQEARQYDPFYSTYNQEKSPTQTTKSNQLFNHKATTDSHQDEYDDDYMQITQDTTPLDRMRINHNESFNYPEQSSNLAKESTQEVGNSLPNTPETQRRHTLDQTHGQSLIFEDPVDQTVSIEDTQPIHSPLRQSTASHINMGYTTPLALRELSSVRHSVNYLSPFSSLRSRSAIRPQSFHGRSGFRSAISHRTSSIHPEHGTTPNHSEFLFESSIGQSNRNPIYLNASQTSRRRRSLGNSEADVFSREQDSSMDIYNQTTENILGIDIEGLYESPRVEPLFPTQMSLPSFLKHIGIRFEENISNDNRPPTTFSVEEATPATMAEQAATAATTLPQLEIYKKMCIDMRNTQMHCKEVVENIYREKDIESQQLSKEFFSSDANSRCEMINRLKLIKQLSLMKSKTIVDEQRSSQIEGLNERLRSTYEKLKQDVNYNNTFENNLEEKLPEFYAYKYRVNSAFGEAKKREETYNKVDHEAMGRLEVEIDEQRAAMQVFREQNEELESEEFQLRERSEALQQRKVELLEALELAKKIREENKYSTENDVAQAKERFKNNASKLQLNIIKKTEETTEVVISNDIRVTINIKELKKNPCEAVSVRVEENRKNVHEEFTELIHGINMIIKDEKNQYKVLQKIIFYWHRVRAIRREIVFVGWRFESVLKPLTGESLTPDKRGVRVDITVFSYVSKVKFKLSLQFVSNDIFLYPALDLSNVEIVVSYGDVPVEKLRGLLAENGIVNLERTLCNFLSSLQNK
ncbi:Spc7 kinetochore protein-domain-containing protein [Phycomyces blakesleeanus]|uniref:Spc7 kinetochore protein-domain-containing protein n=1 Tax=Phycomyces blakesleeanus TaxID=4837 RepID=A0ABR3BCI9_PHYBL